MQAVKRKDHNVLYKGEHEEDGRIVNQGVLDLSCYRPEPGVIVSHWLPTPDELAVLNAGGHVELAIHSEPIPPVSITAVMAEGKRNGHPIVTED